MIKLDFNREWIFSRVGIDGQEEGQTVHLPHDAMLHERRNPACKNGRTTGYFPGGKYLYIKRFLMPADWLNKTLILEFEGVYQNAKVTLNGKQLCMCPNGYTGFFVEVTDELKSEEENILEVEADNSGEPCSRWYCGSGIYRPVWIHIGERNCIRPDSVRIQTRSYMPAVLNVKTAVSGDVRITVLDGDREAAHGEGTDVDIVIPDAKLWSDETPDIYSCRIRLYEEDILKDEVTVNCGICKIQWSTGGLFINGRETKLRGACIHHDNGILGACEFPESAMRRARILKEAGFNAVRSAHNPMSRAMLEACDKAGLYVMDEFSDMWYEHKSRWDYASYFEEWYRKDLEAMVKKDYSHPSVIMYSIGNEVTETAEEWGIQLTREMTELIHAMDDTRPVTCGINMALNTMHFAGLGVYIPGPDEPPKREQKKNPRAMALLAEMAQAVKLSNHNGHTDSSAQADSGTAGRAALGITDQMGARQDGKLVGSEYFNEMMRTMKERQRRVVTQPIAKILSEEAYAALDIAGYNYADGRYENDAEEYPDRISAGTETLPQRIYKNWNLVRRLPYIIGDFMWTGWDYLGEAGIGAFCYDSVGNKNMDYPALLAGSGVIDITGQPRPEVWLNKAVYGLSKGPYIGVEPVTHSHENRLISAWRYSDAVHSWSWAGCEGKKAELVIYADAATVELFLNGVSIGAGRVEECQAKFETTYQPGELIAAAYDEDGVEIGRDRLITAENETVLSVKAEKEVLEANGQDVCYLDIYLADENGIVKASEDRVVKVEVSGPGILAGLGNADPFSEEAYTGNCHRTYYGHAQAVVRAGCEAGEIKVTVTADHYLSKQIVVQVLQNLQGGKRNNPDGDTEF